MACLFRTQTTPLHIFTGYLEVFKDLTSQDKLVIDINARTLGGSNVLACHLNQYFPGGAEISRHLLLTSKHLPELASSHYIENRTLVYCLLRGLSISHREEDFLKAGVVIHAQDATGYSPLDYLGGKWYFKGRIFITSSVAA